MKRGDRRPFEERFADHVHKGPGCWLWTGPKSADGYGMASVGAALRARFGSTRYAHRMAYIMAKGPIPARTLVCHTCDNPSCVRPDHLFLGTNRENMLDASRKGRIHKQQATHCKRGHPYSGQNLYVEPRTGWRRCRVCMANRWRKPVSSLDDSSGGQ